jgi:PAS domain S-box-containing protein
VEQARVTADAVSACLRAVATLDEGAAIDDLLAVVADALGESLGCDGIALASAGGTHRIRSTVGSLADLRSGEQLPGLGDELGDGVVELDGVTVRSHTGERRRPGQLAGVRTDGLILVVEELVGAVTALPALAGVLDVELRRRAAVDALTERVKELEAHRRVQAAAQSRLPLDQLRREIVAAVRHGLRYPEAVRVELDLDGEVTSCGPDGALRSTWKSSLTVDGVVSGSLRVGYVGPQQLLEPHEPALVDAVAETLQLHLGRERARQESAEAAERLASLVRSAALAIVAMDLDGCVTAWNHGAEQLLGWRPAEMLGTELADLLPEDASGLDLPAMQHELDEGRSVETFELRMRHRDGSYRELEGSLSPLLGRDGQPVGSSVIYRDVSERNAALRRLAENEQLFRRLAESNQDVVYRVALGSEPRVEYASPSAHARLGFGADELVADPGLVTSRIHPDDRAHAVGPASWDADTRSRQRFRFQHADGRWLWLDDRRSPLTDPNGRVVGLSGVLRDITGEVESELRLRAALERERRAADQLRRVDEMKTTFLSAVSHELRTPLTSILGFAQTAERTLVRRDGADPVLNYIRRIVANADRLGQLIGDLLDVDRLAREAPDPRLTRIDLSALVRDLTRRAGSDDHAVVLDLPERCDADVDVLLVERSIHSLLDNAVRHTPAGTTVTVRLTADEDHLSLVVEDDGPGVPEVERARLFAPFAQGEGAATAANPGTGIGLALVDRFVRVHGGQVHLDERPGGGARFTLDLPRWAPAA